MGNAHHSSGWPRGLLCGLVGIAVTTVATGAEVNGIYTEPATKDLGQLTSLTIFDGLKVRGWVDVYYEYNLNSPPGNTVIGGRVFDIEDQSFTLEQVELELEKVPERGGLGFKLDLAAGDAQDQIFDSISTFHGPDSLSEGDRYVQHASLAYLAPLGRGLRIDAGKFVTHIGGETIESIKNNNFSHSYYFTYAIPFQDTGLRLNYAWTETFYTEMYVLNGWNTTTDPDDQKSVGVSFGWTLGPVSWYLNYLGGDETDAVTDCSADPGLQAGCESTYRTLIDTQVFWALDRLNLAFAYDRGEQDDIPGLGDVEWYGYAAYARYKVTDVFEPALRFEIYKDPDGFTVGTPADKFTSVTLTLNYRLGGGQSHLLLRPEFRWDKADTEVPIFADDDGNPDDTQSTVAINAIYYF